MDKKWVLQECNMKVASDLTKALQIPSVLAELLTLRGITDFESARTFFRPSLNQLHDPFLMDDMAKAAARLEKAISNNERIMIYGDYDVDGTTSVTLVFQYLSRFTQNIIYYIPDRYAEGYGLSEKGVRFAHGKGVDLLITLDCGIKAIDRIDLANELGIETIICDHHKPGKQLPNALAVLDPKKDQCAYPFKELCGCGVGFKLLQAFAIKGGRNMAELYRNLDLLALAIGADIVPITGENRVLMYFGLQQINQSPRPGIEAMLKMANKKKRLNVSDLVFILGPRINAAGRIHSATRAVELLLSNDTSLSEQVAKEIEKDNTTRRFLDRSITEEALKMLKETPSHASASSNVVYSPNWHKGVIGIVASRIMETYYRPTIVLTQSGDQVTGSARSVKGFDIYNALEACKDHLIQFGGHKYAAGMTLSLNQIDDFKSAFETTVKNTISPDSLKPLLTIDRPLNLNEITPKLYRIIQQMAPFGPGNMTPTFLSEGLKDAGNSKLVGADLSHLKLEIKQENSNAFQGIAFGLGDALERIKKGDTFKLVYTIEENTWNDRTTLQLMVKDLKFDESVSTR